MSLISKGNHKLAKTVGIFNLPSGLTCPGSDAICRQVCYARKPERYSKQALASRMANWEASKRDDFVDVMIEAITKSKCPYFRWHESGDVYSNEYLSKIFRICSALPQVQFLMYTKSFKLDFSSKPLNLVVYWSTTDANAAQAPTVGPRAHIVLKGQTSPPGYVTCQTGGQKQHYCGNICTYCFLGKNNVYFIQH